VHFIKAAPVIGLLEELAFVPLVDQRHLSQLDVSFGFFHGEHVASGLAVLGRSPAVGAFMA